MAAGDQMRICVDIQVLIGYYRGVTFRPAVRLSRDEPGISGSPISKSAWTKLVIGVTRMKKTWFSILMALVIALTVVTPAAAAKKWDLNIHNDTEDSVQITLTGPEDYSFTVEPGKWLKTVVEGEYKYSYGACGEKFSGEITVEDAQQWLIIDPCGAIPTYEKFVVDSHLGESLTLQLVGPQTYDLAVSLGTNKFINLQTGYYTFKYTACGGDLSGLVQITKNGKARLTLYSCEVVALHPLGIASPVSVPTNLRIGSHYSFPVRLTLSGPTSYSFEVVPGLNRFNVVDGTYSYTYTAYGQFFSGTFTVAEAGTSFIISPLR